MNVHFSSNTDIWSTPQYLFEDLNKEFNFVLDPCAIKINHKCDSWYGPDHDDPLRRDGLLCDWSSEAKSLNGSIFVNPPYGKTISKWMEKSYTSSLSGVSVVCLVPARTDTRWFHNYCIDNEIRFIKGRLKFGNSTNSAPFPSAIVVMRTDKST
jgi:phage N-6-adenine-methyltransferase